eukprot:m.581682 g.581682  ORF g.581682 m.581682 type:complete len:62 (+) comp57937_c2_seq20:974-1159(+)
MQLLWARRATKAQLQATQASLAAMSQELIELKSAATNSQLQQNKIKAGSGESKNRVNKTAL